MCLFRVLTFHPILPLSLSSPPPPYTTDEVDFSAGFFIFEFVPPLSSLQIELLS